MNSDTGSTEKPFEIGEQLLKDEKTKGVPIRHISGVLEALEQKIISGAEGIHPGYNLLAKTIRKITPGHMWVVGGYTSVGKSFFLNDLVCRLYRAGNPGVAIFSTEMSSGQYALRMLANRTTYSTWVIEERKLVHKAQLQALKEAWDHFNTRNLYLYDDLYNFKKIEQTIEAIKHRKGLDVIAIDYIQNLQGKGSVYERMSALSPAIQAMSKRLEVCSIVLSQVSNEAAKEDLSIIGYKGAGEIAAAADLGVWLQREEKEKENVRFMIRKNRHGMTGEGLLVYSENYTRFEEREKTS